MKRGRDELRDAEAAHQRARVRRWKIQISATISRMPDREPDQRRERRSGSAPSRRCRPTARRPEPLLASTAPTTPPIRQCDELEGSAHHQVRRFHAIAPTSPPSITGGVTAAGSTMPFASVAATCVETSAPTHVQHGGAGERDVRRERRASRSRWRRRSRRRGSRSCSRRSARSRRPRSRQRASIRRSREPRPRSRSRRPRRRRSPSRRRRRSPST